MPKSEMETRTEIETAVVGPLSTGHPFELPWWNDYLDSERDGQTWHDAEPARP